MHMVGPLPPPAHDVSCHVLEFKARNHSDQKKIIFVYAGSRPASHGANAERGSPAPSPVDAMRYRRSGTNSDMVALIGFLLS